MVLKKFKESKKVSQWKKKMNRFINRVKTLFQFIKLGWNDYWFDSYYIESLLIFKLRQMGNKFQKLGNLEGSEESAKEMIYVADLLESVHNLEDLMYNELDEEYNPPKVFSIETSIENGKTKHEFKLTKEYEEFIKTKKGKEYEKKQDKLIDYLPKKRLQIRKDAYKLLAEKIENWWD